jgi:hypothetical protein
MGLFRLRFGGSERGRAVQSDNLTEGQGDGWLLRQKEESGSVSESYDPSPRQQAYRVISDAPAINGE